MPTPNKPDESTPLVTSPSTMPEGDLSQGLGACRQQPSGLPSSASADPIPPSVATRLAMFRCFIIKRSSASIAAELGISQQCYCNYEHGRTINLDVVVGLWKKFGLSPEWLLRGTGSMDTDTFPQGETAADALCELHARRLAVNPCSLRFAPLVSDCQTLRDLAARVAASMASIVRPSSASKSTRRPCGRQDIPPNLPPQPVEAL